VIISRCTSVTSGSQIEIHGFCDASQEAYGACVYVQRIEQIYGILSCYVPEAE